MTEADGDIMARDIYRRSKSARRTSKGGAPGSSPQYRVPSIEIFSRMSTEALQAIDETRQEMNKKEPKERKASSQGATVDHNAVSVEKAAVKGKEQKTEDNDSAIGTCSMKSHPLGGTENNNTSLPQLTVVEHVMDHNTAEGTNNTGHRTPLLATNGHDHNTPQITTNNKEQNTLYMASNKYHSEPHITVHSRDTDGVPQRGSGTAYRTERVRPATVCAHRTPTDEEIKRRQELAHPGIRSSQWIQDCISRHTPGPAPTIAPTKKLSVFERLAAPVQTTYKITARQRARARLSISMSVNNDRQSFTSFGQRRVDTRRDSTKSSFPGMSRPQQKSVDNRLQLHPRKEVTKTIMEKNKQTDVNSPALVSPYAKLQTEKVKNNPAAEQNLGHDHESFKPIRLHDLQPSRPFEITPIGYDSRYMALKADSQRVDDEECEIIKQSKIKCRQWLEHQLALLTSS